MKRPLAYITAAWCGIPEVDTDLAVEFCRAAYEAGLAPICPKLYLPLILNDSVPEEHKDGIDMGRDMLKRSRMLLVCGGTVDEGGKTTLRLPPGMGLRRPRWKAL